MLLCVLKTTDVGGNPYRLDILVQITLFCMHKRTGEDWDPYRTCNSGPKVADFHAKTTDEGWDP